MSPQINEKLLKAVYKVLEPFEDRGMVTMIFRYQLGNLMGEDDDNLLLELEENLIKEGWISQNPINRLITINDQLRGLFEK